MHRNNKTKCLTTSIHTIMKRYKISQIMKSAWSLAKLQEYCSPEAVKARTDQFLAERHEAMSNAAKATMDKGYNNKSIPASAYYTASTGRYGAHYVGD